VAERPFQPVPNTPLVADPTGDAIWKRWLQGLQSFLGRAVRGPGSSTDNAVARWDGTSGTFLNNSGVIIDDSNNVSGIVNLTTTGNTILGDAAADTITFNAATWTLANNVTATRTAGTIATGEVRLLNYEASFTGDAGGATNARGFRSYLEAQGANNISVADAMLYIGAHNGSGTVTLLEGIEGQTRLLSTGNVTTAIPVAGFIDIRSTGSVSVGSVFLAASPFISGGGTITQYNGLQVRDAGSASIGTVNGVLIADQTLATVAMSGIRSELSAGAGKKNINVTGTADNSLAGPLYLAQDNKTQQTACALYAGTGVPDNANGNNNDFYFRGNGTIAGSTIVYHKEAGVWVALTGGGGGGASATTVELNLGSTPVWRGKFTITDAAISATSKVQCWQAPGPYTGKGTRADEAEMQPIQVIAVAPATGSAVVYWQTPPMVAMEQQYSDGKFNAAGATFDRLMNQRDPAVFTPTRINKVRGNVKFTYSVYA
jgi:hypothetical protein